MFNKRTDLALEARELWQESAEKTTKLPGVKAVKYRKEGYPVTRVEVLDEQGEQELGKPVGTYLTLDLSTYWQRKSEFFERAVRLIGSELKALMPAEGAALVIGLGNDAMTPDAVGPLTMRSILITRHLRSAMPKQFAGFRGQRTGGGGPGPDRPDKAHGGDRGGRAGGPAAEPGLCHGAAQ